LALLMAIGYFLVLLVGESTAWIVSRITLWIEERRYNKSPIRST